MKPDTTTENQILKTQLNSLFKRFIIQAVVLFIAWQMLYYLYIVPNGVLNEFLSTSVVQGTDWGLRILGYNTHYEGHYVYMDNDPVVWVSDTCNGLELFVLYIGFLISFPGKWLYKSIFIPLGVVILFLLNVGRNMALLLNYRFFEKSFDFNHKYTYVFVIYIVVFAIWRFWVNNYSSLADNKRI
jgi:exosortase/archaeosortase family protein